MSSDDDLENERDDDDEEYEDFDEEEYPSLPADLFHVSGLQCLNENRIFAVTLIREKGKPLQLVIEYTIDEERLEMLTAPFERFTTEEAYYTIVEDDDVHIATFILSNLELTSMELGHDVNDEDCLMVYMTYNVEGITLKRLKEKEKQ